MPPRKRAAARAAPQGEAAPPVGAAAPVEAVPPQETVPAPAAAAALVFAPGLGRHPANTADLVADLIAATASRDRAGTYVADASRETAPRGLRVAKTVYDPDRNAVLEVFELDYRDRVANLEAGDRPGSPLGVVRAVYYAAMAFGLTVGAFKRGAKTAAAKLQLLLAFGLAMVMAALALASIAVLVGLLPGDAFDDRKPVAATAGLTLAGAWAWVRPRLLGAVAHLRAAMRYQDDERHRDTVTQALDDAVDGLRDAGWEGRPIHVLGYSYGSLVVIDALLPRRAKSEDRLTGAVTTLVTIGCPADAVRLFYPKAYERRVPRVPGLPWTNVYIAADVFGSNFVDGEDVAPQGKADFAMGGERPSATYRYTEHTLSFWSFLRFRGFSLHGGYWGGRDEDSCFDLVLPTWLPPRA